MAIHTIIATPIPIIMITTTIPILITTTITTILTPTNYYGYDYYPSFSFVYKDYEYKYDYQPTPQPQPNPQVDLKVNGSDSSLSLPYSEKTITLSWTSQHADSCQASGDWSETKPLSDSEQITLSNPRNYRFTLTCKNSSGKEASDLVSITLQNPEVPRVITKLITR